MLAPIRLTNAAAQLPLRGQVRRKEKHPLPAPHHSRPYARGHFYTRFMRRSAFTYSNSTIHSA